MSASKNSRAGLLAQQAARCGQSEFQIEIMTSGRVIRLVENWGIWFDKAGIPEDSWSCIKHSSSGQES